MRYKVGDKLVIDKKLRWIPKAIREQLESINFTITVESIQESTLRADRRVIKVFEQYICEEDLYLKAWDDEDIDHEATRKLRDIDDNSRINN